MIRARSITVAIFGVVLCSSATEGQRSPDVERLLATARLATEQFADRRVAIANGYKRVGRDLPSMGEHWLSTRVLVDGRLDPAKPALLTYLMIDGRAMLTGVVYAVPLAPGESPPADFGPDAKWHEHNGDVDDEALLPEHHTTSAASAGTRVAFLHAWLRVASPDGIFSAENWAIPFLRVKVPAPEKISSGAARAVSLVTGGKIYFLDLVGPAAASLVEPFLDECGALATSIVAAARFTNRAMTVSELAQLDAKWNAAMDAVVKAAGVSAARKMNGGLDPHPMHGS